MSKWVEIRDAVVDALQLDDVTEQVKEDLTKNMLDSGLPALEDVADTFVAKIQLQATEEKGWNKVRDQVVLPLHTKIIKRNPVKSVLFWLYGAIFLLRINRKRLTSSIECAII